GTPAEGAYVHYPFEDLLGVLALESRRQQCLIVGEDLGTVEPGVRRRLAAASILSTRLALFERRPPARWPRNALGAVTTHDLPTVTGILTRADLEDQERAGLVPDARGLARLRAALERSAPIDGLDPAAAVLAIHRALAGAPCAMTAATLEDALLVGERPNVPGTTAEQRPNWSLALPLPLEALLEDRRLGRLARAMRRRPGA
ncbi:MAG TPA: 4-alpha-glucanotransferase, partial [Candidatus Limnocylindria bacterium]